MLEVDGHVLVVDDGSTDKTREVMADLAERHPEVELDLARPQPGQGHRAPPRLRPRRSPRAPTSW